MFEEGDYVEGLDMTTQLLTAGWFEHFGTLDNKRVVYVKIPETKEIAVLDAYSVSRWVGYHGVSLRA